MRDPRRIQASLIVGETLEVSRISRVWAMPSPDTFSIPPISDLLDRYLLGCLRVVDPFARESKRGQLTNDLDIVAFNIDNLIF